MNRIVYIIFCVGAISACQNKDAEQLCKCIELGEKVNKFSASFFERDYSELGKDSLDRFIAERDQVCQQFDDMHPHELQKLAIECESLEIDVSK